MRLDGFGPRTLTSQIGDLIASWFLVLFAYPLQFFFINSNKVVTVPTYIFHCAASLMFLILGRTYKTLIIYYFTHLLKQSCIDIHAFAAGN